MKKVLLLSALTFLWCTPVSAHQPEFAEPQNVDDYIEIPDPEISRAYYGELTNFPHAYTLTLEEPTQVFFELLLPDIEGVNRRSSILIVKRVERGVEEVARAGISQSAWEQFNEPFANDDYLRGPSYEQELPAGEYIIEVSSPNNRTKYVLVSGKAEVFNILEYPSLVGDIARVKRFYGKSSLMAIESPIVYVPLIIVTVLTGMWYWRRKRKQARDYA